MKIRISISLLLLCFSCSTYDLSNGRKFRVFKPVKDWAFITPEELTANKFDPELFYQANQTDKRVQFVFPEDLKKMVATNNDTLLIIFYNPNCSVIDAQLILPKFAEENHISYLLLSDIYSPTRMKAANEKHSLANQNQYIIPTIEGSDPITLRKKINFLCELSPELYTERKDDLMFTALVFMTKDTIELNPFNSEGRTDNLFLTNWVKEKYGIQ